MSNLLEKIKKARINIKTLRIKRKIIKDKKKSIENSIKSLVKLGKYDEVFSVYGPDAYYQFVPNRIKNKEYKRLKNEGRYEDIYIKLDSLRYYKALKSAMFHEIKQEQGMGKAIFWRIKEGIKDSMRRTLRYGFMGSAIFLGTSGFETMVIDTNSLLYKSEIKDYNSRIEEYAKENQNLGLNKLQIIMKTINDIWEYIPGYMKPKSEIDGFEELALSQDSGGVCKNIAPDFCNRLNAIDPSFNARTIVVYMDDSDSFYPSIVDLKIVEDDNISGAYNSISIDNISKSELKNNIKDFMVKIRGNHMVTLVDIPEDNIILVVDPTNSGLGIYLDGKITMFNPKYFNYDKNYYYGYGDSKMGPRKRSTLTQYKGIRELGQVIADYKKSFSKPNLTFEELLEKYGLEAQNKALKEIWALELAKNTIQEVDDKDNKTAFDDRIQCIVNNALTAHAVETKEKAINEDRADLDDDILK